jgi:type II secretory ATPase GspE/PulE/Tfp pilus assembly ATPase PilB-like protein
MVQEFPPLLIDRLMTEGLLSWDQIAVAKTEQKTQGDRTLIQTILDLGFMTEDALAAFIAEEEGQKQFTFNAENVCLDTLKKISRQEALTYHVLPYLEENGILHIAMADIYDVQAQDFLRRRYGNHLEIIPHIATSSHIIHLIDELYEIDGKIDDVLKNLEHSVPADGTIHRFIQVLLRDAVRTRASDIHLSPEGPFVGVRFRIDGVLQQICTFHGRHWESICVYLKVQSETSITQTRLPQSGQMTLWILGRWIDIRLSTHPTLWGENIVLRILDKKKEKKTLESLGFSKKSIHMMHQWMSRKEGLILVTGPTGSGKTTTMHGLLSTLSSQHLNIMTLEDPVEYIQQGLRQTSIKEDIGLDFAAGIRAVLRQDPDVILVGEIRDEATAQMALRASLTGHLVIATLHCRDTINAFARLKDLGIGHHLLTRQLIGITAQRLVRLLCVHCRQETPNGWIPSGCVQCHHYGYKNRHVVEELLPIDRFMEDLLLKNYPYHSMVDYQCTQDWPTLKKSAFQLVSKAMTTKEEIAYLDMG